MKKVTLAVVAFATAVPLLSQGGILFQDTFDRAADYNNRDINSSIDGIINNTGTAFTDRAGGGTLVYQAPYVDPNWYESGVDGNSSNGGGMYIAPEDYNLHLASGAGTANVMVDHNFVNQEILDAGGFRVSVDINGFANSDVGFGGAFAIGMTRDEAMGTGDAGLGTTTMTGAFGSSSSISDFWCGMRGDGSMGYGSDSVNSYAAGAKTGTVSAEFTVGSFLAGSTVDYTVFYDGTEVDSGSFTWSSDNANYIGMDARDSSGVLLDNFTIETIPEPATLSLIGVATAGLLIARRLKI